MKTSPKSFLIVITLLVILIGALPASPVRAESLASPLQASGDFVYAKSMSGTDVGSGEVIAVDSLGNIYTAGYFSGTVDFDPGAGIFSLVNAAGLSDMFISKLDASGNFVWAKQVVDAGTSSIALDSSGNLYLTGSFSSTVDFDPGAGIANLINAGSTDIFILKLDNAGNFIWATRMGGTGYDYGVGIVADLINGTIYTTGGFNNVVDFDPGVGVANLTSAGNDDIFVSKLDSNGNFIWAKNMGGTNTDRGINIAVDLNGNVYTTGFFSDVADFDPDAGIFNLTSAGDYDIFVSKLGSNGSFIWAKSMGGVDSDDVKDIAVDSSGNVYTTGRFNSTADFNPSLGGVDNLVSAGQADVFVSKLDGNGNYIWAKRMGGTLFDEARGIVLDSSGNIYTTGSFEDTADFDPGLGFTNLVSAGVTDIFVSKLDSNGNFGFAKSMGGTQNEYGNAISLDPSGNVYTTGHFAGTADFNPSGVVTNLTSTGGYDIFISKLERAPIATALVNSVLPTSRSIPVGTLATIFNTVINAGTDTAYGVTLSINPAPAGTFAYQQTNCATNAVIGLPNSFLDVAPGQVLCYVLSFTPNAVFAATNVHIRAQASNAPSTNLLTGINTWLLRSTAVAGPDIIALTTTVDFHQIACSGVNAFAVALSNVGAAAVGDITAVAHTGAAILPLSISIMETNPGDGVIIGDHLLQNVGAGENRTVAVFVTFNGCVNFDPAANRIFIEFRDASNNVVGSTSTAVSTNR